MSNLSPLEQRAAQLRKEKFKTDKLELETVQNNRDSLPATLDQPKQSSDFWYQQKVNEYRDKFNIKCNALECEGLLGARLRQNEQTLESLSIDHAREDMRGKKLKIAQGSYQGNPLKLYLEISKT